MQNLSRVWARGSLYRTGKRFKSSNAFLEGFLGGFFLGGGTPIYGLYYGDDPLNRVWFFEVLLS